MSREPRALLTADAGGVRDLVGARLTNAGYRREVVLLLARIDRLLRAPIAAP